MLLDDIKRFFGICTNKNVLTGKQLAGFVVGGAIGEALGLPVVGKSAQELAAEPVTELLGFGDYATPAGSYSVCEDSLLDFCQYLADNFRGGFEPEKFFGLLNNWYLIKAKDEDQRLKIMLPCAALSGIFYAKMKKNRSVNLSKIPDILCDEAVAPTSLIFYLFSYFSQGFSMKKSLKMARKSSEKLQKIIGLKIFSGNFYFVIIDAITICASINNGYQNGLLKAVNLGGKTDLVGNILGNLLGLFYGLENIPYFWRKFLRNETVLLQKSRQICEMNGVKNS